VQGAVHSIFATDKYRAIINLRTKAKRL